MTSPSPKAQVWSCPWQRRWISGGSAVGCKYRHTILLLLVSAVVAHGQPAKPVEDLPGLFLDRSSAVRSTDPRLTEPRTATKSEGQGKRNTSSDDPAAQRRIVGIAKEQLARARGQASAGSAPRLRLNLLAGVDMTAVIERTARTSRGYSLAGHIAGMEEVSNVVLVVNGTVVVGDVWTPQGHYTIRTANGGSYLIEKTDPAERKPLAEPVLPLRVEDDARDAERRSANGSQATGDGGEDDGSTIDIFVFWTQNARLGAGGLRNMQAFVDLAIAGANEAYLASDVQTRLNLVGATEVHYDYERTDNNGSTLLGHLAAPDDGYMTEVHEVRDAYSADLVHLIVNRGDANDIGGIAQLWGAFGASLADVSTLTHEVGHNMGLDHDAYQLATDGYSDEDRRDIEQGFYGEHIRLYGIGYVNQRAFDAGADAERGWTTVMAYGSQCIDNGIPCEWLLRHSNPRQRWPDENGDPMGIAEEDAGPDELPADASRAVNENRRALANWRQRPAPCRFGLSADVLEVPADGGSYTVEVGGSDGSCPWRAVTNETFLDVAVEGDTVLIRAAPNEGVVRWGVVSITGKPVLLRQQGTVAMVSVCDRAPAVRQAIVDATGHTACQDVTTWDVAAVSSLDLSGRGLASLSGNDVNYLASLKELYLDWNGLEDISALKELRLGSLYLDDNAVEDISALGGMTSLDTLSVSNNAIEDISALSGLANLYVLSLSGNRIEDISALSGLANLHVLSLNGNRIEDISALKELSVRDLYLDDNAVEDISALGGMTSLATLTVSSNAIKDISAAAGLTNLSYLALERNAIEDLSALAGLTKLDRLDLGGNAVEDVSPLSGMTRLRYVDLLNNAIEDISPLLGNAGLGGGRLHFLHLSGNPLDDESAGAHVSTLRGRGVDVVFSPSIRVDDAVATEGETLSFRVRLAPPRRPRRETPLGDLLARHLRAAAIRRSRRGLFSGRRGSSCSRRYHGDDDKRGDRAGQRAGSWTSGCLRPFGRRARATGGWACGWTESYLTGAGGASAPSKTHPTETYRPATLSR